jgi:cytoskeletal protein RodZ
MTKSRIDQRGFGVVEALLVVVIVGAIAGIGVYVVRQKNHTDTLLNKTNTTGAASTVAAPSAGTTASVDQLTEQETQTEVSADHASDARVSQDATSANSAATNVGSAYNEANF